MTKRKKKKSPRQIAEDRVQKLANKHARLRDCAGTGGAMCISCLQWFDYTELHGGHFIPATSPVCRFDERNINAQCARCNLYLHSNARMYYKGMIRKYGIEVTEELENMENRSKKWTLEELLELEIYYKEKIAKLL